MAIIGKIHEKGKYLLVGLLGLALLLFIAGAFFDTFGKGGQQITLGTIDGEAVDAAMYQKYVDQFVNNDAMQAQQSQRPYGDMEREQSEDRAWQVTVNESMMQGEFEALGINVSDREFTSYLYGEEGFSLLPDIQQNFTDPATGKFNKTQFQTYLSERDKATDPEQAKAWKETKESIRKSRMQEKYFQILTQGVYVTKLEAKQEYVNQKTSKQISFVVRSFRDIPDEDVKITDKEIRDFYEKNKDKKKFEVLAGRDVKYFDITIQPSKADSNEFNAKMNEIKVNFGRTVNDSLFVIQKSESKIYSSGHLATYRPEGDPKARPGMTYPMALDTVFKTATKGQIVGPYVANGKVNVAKVLDFNTKICKVRHILISAQKGDDAKIAKAKVLADSIGKIANKDNFEALVRQYSEDPGSKDKGGVYEDFMDYEMVEPFSKFSTDQPIGKIGVVQTDFGFHIIEVLDRKEVKYPVLAVVDQTLKASANTEANLSAKANSLLYQLEAKLSKKEDIVTKLNLFDTIAKKEGFFARPVRMLEEAPRVQGFNTKMAANKILELAFGEDAKVGQLCGSPIYDKDRYVIAIISSIREKGVPSYEDAYQQMRIEAIKEKKANKFKKQIGGNRNLASLAKKGNTMVMTADVTFGNPSIAGAGFEPEVVGALFSGLKDGKTTIPLVGNSGVYVIKLNKTIKAPAAANYDTERNQLLSQLRGNVQNGVSSSLSKKLVVMDNRYLNQAGIYR